MLIELFRLYNEKSMWEGRRGYLSSIFLVIKVRYGLIKFIV